MASKKNISALIDKMGGKGPAKVRTIIYAHHEFDTSLTALISRGVCC